MCKAKKYSEQLQKIFKDINSEFVTLSGELSETDKCQQDILHRIEQGGFNAAEGYMLAKMIFDTRQKRREIKNELEPLHQLKNQFIDKSEQNLNSTVGKVVATDNKLTTLKENKTYNPRVINVDEQLQVVNKKVKNDTVMRYKKNNRELIQLIKVEDNLFYGKFKDGNKCLINKKDILNFDESKVV